MAAKKVRQVGRTLTALGSLLIQRREVYKTLLYVRNKRLTYLSYGALADLALSVSVLEQKNVPGILVEAGAALGGSSIVLASAKDPKRALQVYDTFEMIPPPGQADGEDAHRRYDTIRSGKAEGFGGDPYYGYQDNLFDQVRQSFASAGYPIEKNSTRLIEGLIEETMRIEQSVALAHIDCDWYSPVYACLEQVVPHLSTGGRIVVDDYDHWSGARKAVDEYFRDKKDSFIFERRSRLHIIKKYEKANW